MQRVRVETTSPLHVTVNGDHVALDKVTLLDRRRRASPWPRAGSTETPLKGAMSGHLDLELLQPFLRGAVQSLSGDLKVEVKAAGTLAKPDLRGQVVIVRRRQGPAPRTSPATSPSARASSAPRRGRGVSVKNVAVTVEGATLPLSRAARAWGPASCPRTSRRIRRWRRERQAPRLRRRPTPSPTPRARRPPHCHSSPANAGAAPQVRARLDLGAIDFRLRDVGTQVQIKSGLVEVSNAGVVLHNVKVPSSMSRARSSSGPRACAPVAFSSRASCPSSRATSICRSTASASRLPVRPATFEVDDLGLRFLISRARRRRLRALGRDAARLGPLPPGLQGAEPPSSVRASTSRPSDRSTTESRCWRGWSPPHGAHGRRGVRRAEQHRARDPCRRAHPRGRHPLAVPRSPATCARPTAASTCRSCAATSIWSPTSTTSPSSPPSQSPTATRPT